MDRFSPFPGEEGTMKIITVYRVDYVRKTRVAIGWVAERRQKERGDNLLGLLRLARKIYGTGASEALYITVDWKEARRAYAGPAIRAGNRLSPATNGMQPLGHREGCHEEPDPDRVVASSDRQFG